MDHRADDQDIDDVVREMTDLHETHGSNIRSIPSSVEADEAVHAVQRHYADAGFDCDERTARAIVDDAR